jgi:adsorption protein B
MTSTLDAAWKALEEHRARLGAVSLRQLFARDPDRFARFSLRLDDLLIDILWLAGIGRRQAAPLAEPAREKRIAILVPLWQESAVIGRMLEHNAASIRYSNYEILAGVYANDPETRHAVEAVAERVPCVTLAEVPHDGPTSKADCLNWIYQRLIERELGGAPRAEIVLIHDAEDVIHPESLQWINRWSEQAGMIQIPVFALATGWSEMTHGVYCDDFAESQCRDLPVRAALGGFLPGCGVGTAFRREELERLAEAESNRIFDPLSLTEDYDNGLRLFRLGCRQMVMPPGGSSVDPVATREYFPRNFRAAVRQRTRWITGNCLQAWQRHGWGRGLRRPWIQAWFFWRDRKSLWGSWAGIACNLLLLWGFVTWAASVAGAGVWEFGRVIASTAWLGPVLAANLALCCGRVAMRAWFSSRIYGWKFALAVPLRTIWGNAINAAASARAIWQFTFAWWTGCPLRWLKTEHCYPSLETLRASAAGAAAGSWIAFDVTGSVGASGAPATSAIPRPEPFRWSASPPFAAEDPCLAGPPSKRMLRALPAKVADELGVLPLAYRGGKLEVAAATVLDEQCLELLHRFAGTQIAVRTLSARQIASWRRMRDEPAPPHRHFPFPASPRWQTAAVPSSWGSPPQRIAAAEGA